MKIFHRTKKEFRPVLITSSFVLIVGSGLAYFVSLGIVLPVVPQYAKERLGGSSVEVGIAVGALFLGAVLLRPYVGRLGDRFGRRFLIIGGAATVALSLSVYGLVVSLPFLIAARALTGLGEAAFFVGAAALITDLAPTERRGEAISYWSIAVYGGLALGPVVGEALLESGGYNLVWVAAGGVGAVAVLLGCFTKDVVRPQAVTGSKREPIINRSAVAPGMVLFSGLIALAAFTVFIPLYAGEVGLKNLEVVYFAYAAPVLIVRIFFARIPDRLGAIRSASLALIATTAGMAVLALWTTVAGLLVGTIIFALGSSLLYPALFVLALSRAPETERASVIGTFSSFFDLSQGLGSILVGLAVAGAGYQGGFAAGAVFAVMGFVLLTWRGIKTDNGKHISVDEIELLGSEHSGS